MTINLNNEIYSINGKILLVITYKNIALELKIAEREKDSWIDYQQKPP
jgi:hypothetical protein